ncbi:MAG: CsbD family protein [Pseudomonadota bacterium]
MGKLTDNVKGGVNKAAGKAKQQSADPATRNEGAAQELKGKGQKVKGAIKGALGDDI